MRLQRETIHCQTLEQYMKRQQILRNRRNVSWEDEKNRNNGMIVVSLDSLVKQTERQPMRITRITKSIFLYNFRRSTACTCGSGGIVQIAQICNKI